MWIWCDCGWHSLQNVGYRRHSRYYVMLDKFSLWSMGICANLRGITSNRGGSDSRGNADDISCDNNVSSFDQRPYPVDPV